MRFVYLGNDDGAHYLIIQKQHLNEKRLFTPSYIFSTLHRLHLITNISNTVLLFVVNDKRIDSILTINHELWFDNRRLIHDYHISMFFCMIGRYSNYINVFTCYNYNICSFKCKVANTFDIMNPIKYKYTPCVYRLMSCFVYEVDNLIGNTNFTERISDHISSIMNYVFDDNVGCAISNH